MLHKQWSSKPKPRGYEDGEKETKLRRTFQKSQFRTVLAFLGIAMLLATVAIVKFRHTFKYTNQVLRSRRAAREESPATGTIIKNDKQVELESDFVPPTSIYRLSVLDSSDQLVSLKKFQGMVTLIVNVACQ
jgi:hypothetical protein